MSGNRLFSGLFQRTWERMAPEVAKGVSQKPLRPANLLDPFQPDFFWGYSNRRRSARPYGLHPTQPYGRFLCSRGGGAQRARRQQRHDRPRRQRTPALPHAKVVAALNARSCRRLTATGAFRGHITKKPRRFSPPGLFVTELSGCGTLMARLAKTIRQQLKPMRRSQPPRSSSAPGRRSGRGRPGSSGDGLRDSPCSHS